MLCKTLFTALFVAAGASAQTYTFQTAPASGAFLYTSAALAVRWENRPGNSPDTPAIQTPAMVSASLGFKKGGQPTVLFPPLNGPVSNIPTASGSFTWQKMDFSIFTQGTPPPPRNEPGVQWFIQLSDQSTGYISNGQLFNLVESNANATAPAPAPGAPAPGAPAPSAPASSAPAPSPSNASPSSGAPSKPAATTSGSPSTATAAASSSTTSTTPQNAGSTLAAGFLSLSVVISAALALI